MLHFQTLTTQWNLDFSNLQGIRKLVPKIGELEILKVKIKCFTKGRKTTFGSSYLEFQKIEGSRNKDFIVDFPSFDEF